MEAFNGAGICGEIPEKTGAVGVDTSFYRKTPEKAGVHQKKWEYLCSARKTKSSLRKVGEKRENTRKIRRNTRKRRRTKFSAKVLYEFMMM